MRPWPNLVGLFVLHLFISNSSCESVWVRNAWVRKYPCGPFRRNFPASDTPFWIDSLRGKIDSVGDSTRLSLSILAVHNTSLFDCQHVDVARLEKSLGFQVLGYPVGRVGQFAMTCPLPITDTLTPFDLVFLLNHTHQLQSLVAKFRFHHQNGREMDCAVAKITPSIGATASAAFTYLPAGIMVLVGIASWQTHLGELATNPLFEYGSALAGRSLVWETVVDVAGYLRYLQFVFLSGSLTIDYPGFYQPVVSKIAWSSLLFWRGPIDHGFTYTSIQQGMYINNASYGLDYMAQVLGFPRSTDNMLNALVNLVLLASALFFLLSAFYVLTSRHGRWTSWPSLIRTAGGMTAGAILTLFSFPLLSYTSGEMILIGYLPNYRIFLVLLTLLILVCANYVITHCFGNDWQLKTSSHAESSRRAQVSFDFSQLWTYVSHYLPQSIPLLQAIVVGALQDWGIAQLLALTGSEAVLLLHAILQRSVKLKFLCSKTVWCSVIRLVTTISLTIAVITTASEAAKQWVGYAMLCLHGVVILPGFLSHAIWQLYRATKKGMKRPQEAHLVDSSHANNVQTVNLNDIGSHFVNMDRQVEGEDTSDIWGERLCSLRTYPRPVLEPLSVSLQDAKAPSTSPKTPIDTDHKLEFSPFYRKPRSRNATPLSQLDSPSQSSSSIVPLHTVTKSSDAKSFSYLQPEQKSHETLDALLEAILPPDVDYSVRESDRFYRQPVNGLSPMVSSEETGSQSSRLRPNYHDWKQMLRRVFKRQNKEKGFQVVRPPRQPA